MLNISPAITKDLQASIKPYGFELLHSVGNKTNHRHAFTNGDLIIKIEISKYEK